MTVLALKTRGLRVRAIALLLLAIAAAAALAIALLPGRSVAGAATVTIPLTPARASALVEATSGDQAVQMRAIGEQARLINAALPFASGPVQAARPFASGGDDVDHRRALLCLTQAVYYEAGYEPIEGRRAVAQVVLNRLRHPAFPNSVCGVVYQNNGRVCQFTFVCDGALSRAPARGAWQQAEAVARAALAGYVEASVGGATHYHAIYVAPRWAPLLAKVSEIGQHIFYRWPGAWGMRAAFSDRYAGEPRDPLSLRPVIAVADAEALAGAGVTAAAPGLPVARAENDVGGLLDTSKGWTLHIPGPEESGSSAAKQIALQKGAPAATTALPATASIAPALASR
jgi:hypothetical protein